ncbi:MAG: hypothetical protein QM805_27505 [Pseudomonas sp.]
MLWALCLVILVPGLLALVFGYFAFRSRIKDVYFSIMTQALTYAGMLLFFRNETGFGGNNGFTGFTTMLGFSRHRDRHADRTVYRDRAAAGRSAWRIGFALARSKFGRVLTAVRDAENRLMFCGYDPKRLQAIRLDALRRALRAGRRAVRAAGGHHQPQ